MKKQSFADHQEKLVHLRGLARQLQKEAGKGRPLLRVKALIAYYKGVAPKQVARCFDISLKTLRQWVKHYERDRSVEDAPRSGRPVKLPPEQAQELKAMILADQQRVWTARHVCVLLLSTFGVCYGVKYLPEWLRALDLSFHKAVHTLVRKNAEKRREWIQTKLPALYADHIKEGWRIFFQDEVGFQTEGTLAYTWGPKGETIEIPNHGRHGRVNLIGVVELGSGAFYGLLTSFKMTARRFQRFLCHLKREMRTDKIMVISDNASFHKAKWLQQWFVQQAAWLRVEFLPAYSPDFNPIERLWRWIKAEYTHNRCWASQTALKQDLAQMLTELPQRTAEVVGVMRQEIARLKKVFDAYGTPFPFDCPAPALAAGRGKNFSG